MLLGSSQGGMNIEEVARETPEALCTIPVDIYTGVTTEQTLQVADFMGFTGEQKQQVRNSLKPSIPKHKVLCFKN